MFRYEGSEEGHHVGIEPEKGLSAAANTNNQCQATTMRQRKEEKRDHRETRKTRDEKYRAAQHFTAVEGSQQMWYCILYPLFLALTLIFFSPLSHFSLYSPLSTTDWM